MLCLYFLYFNNDLSNLDYFILETYYDLSVSLREINQYKYEKLATHRLKITEGSGNENAVWLESL
jgi:hypothetical protein